MDYKQHPAEGLWVARIAAWKGERVPSIRRHDFLAGYDAGVAEERARAALPQHVNFGIIPRSFLEDVRELLRKDRIYTDIQRLERIAAVLNDTLGKAELNERLKGEMG